MTFYFTSLNKIEGEAQINVRKGKQIVIYEFNIDCAFRAENESGDCNGNFKINDINQSEPDFQIVSIHLTKDDEISN